MNVHFAATGQRAVNKSTHTILEEGTGVVLGGIVRVKGGKYQAFDRHVGELGDPAVFYFTAQRDAETWYGAREWCSDGCGDLTRQHDGHEGRCYSCECRHREKLGITN